MAARLSIGPTLSEHNGLLNYTEAPESIQMDGGGGDCRLFLVYAYRCTPFQTTLAYLCYPKELVAEDVHHVVITTNIRINRMST